MELWYCSFGGLLVSPKHWKRSSKQMEHNALQNLARGTLDGHIPQTTHRIQVIQVGAETHLNSFQWLVISLIRS